jgi:guanine nucleotide-binding protein subunit beta-2-like 1 protein
MAENALILKGVLEGHSNWVTAIATTDVDSSMVVSSSRGKERFRVPSSAFPAAARLAFLYAFSTRISSIADKTLIVWKITGDPETFGYPEKSLHGHNHFVQDVCLSADGEYALSASWDGTLRLWELTKGVVDKTFVDHSKDVLSCSIAPCNTKVRW